jgi:hypothetical protein
MAMSDASLIAIVAVVPATIAAIGALVIGVMTARQSARRDEAVAKIEHATNSMKDELVALTDKESHARGVKDGVAEERERTA